MLSASEVTTVWRYRKLINCLINSLICCDVDIHNVSYPRVDPSVICAVVSDDDEHCLLVRKPTFPSLMYSLVAGFIDPGNLRAYVVESPVKVHIKVKMHILDIAPLRSESPLSKRSGMARVLKGFHSFTCTPTRSSAIGMSHTFPAIAVAIFDCKEVMFLPLCVCLSVRRILVTV